MMNVKKIFDRRADGSSYLSLLSLSCLLLVLLTALAACAPNSGVLGGGNWQQSGLANQEIRTLAVDSNTAQDIYAGSARGEVFASTDGGQHWAVRDSGLPFPNAINQLAFDPTNKKLYAATASGLFLSTDGAQHWQSVPGAAKQFHNQPLVALAFDLNNPHVIYVATSTGITISMNDGASWTALGSGIPAGTTLYGLTFDSTKHQLWAATSTGIYRYGGSASSWQALNTGLPNGIQVYTVQPAENSGGSANVVYAGTSQGFFVSQDYGGHWAQSQQSLQRTQVHSVFVDFQQPTTVYAGTTGAGVLQSNDSGQTWGGLGPDFPYGHPVYAIQMGGDSYGQLFAAVNAVYYFPGSSGGLSFSHLLPLLVVIVFFFALIRFTGNRRRVNILRANQHRPTQQPSQPAPTGQEPSSEPVPQASPTEQTPPEAPADQPESQNQKQDTDIPS